VTAPGAKPAATAGLAIALVVLGIAWAGRAAEGRRALVESDSALARGDLVEAILAARTAAEARCPGCGAPAAGYARLESIARAAEAKGDDRTAFASLRAARAAAVATRDDDAKARADHELARVGHRLDVMAVAGGATPTAAASEERLRATFAWRETPSAATVALLAAGAVLLLAGAARGVRRGGAGGRRWPELAVAAAGAALAALGLLAF
jgi:hypothetical protein